MVTEEGKKQGKTASEVVVRCTACGKTFAPDFGLKKEPWHCTHCQAKNPNLRRLYRGVADVFILGILGTLVFLVLGIQAHGFLPLAVAQSALWLALLSYGVLRIYRAKAPWLDGVARTLIWLVFVLAFILNVILPLLVPSGRDAALIIPLAFVYGVVFIYVLWVLRVSKRAMAPEA